MFNWYTMFCPECKVTSPWNDWDILGADEGCVFCPECDREVDTDPANEFERLRFERREALHRRSYPMSALCKMNGCLVLMSTTTPPEGRTGTCPACGGVEFCDSPHAYDSGWAECANGDCDFALLKAHLDRLPDDVEVGIGAGI